MEKMLVVVFNDEPKSYEGSQALIGFRFVVKN